MLVTEVGLGIRQSDDLASHNHTIYTQPEYFTLGSVYRSVCVLVFWYLHFFPYSISAIPLLGFKSMVPNSPPGFLRRHGISVWFPLISITHVAVSFRGWCVAQ